MKPGKFLLHLAFAIAFFWVGCKKERSCENCQTNKSPIAVAGTDQTISLPGDSIILDGSASNDPDGSITTWQWRKVSGPSSFTIANTNAANTRVNNLAEGTYLFELRVTDAGGLFDTDTMQLIVDDPNVNQPPLANAGADTTITLPANTVTLNGSSSADPDNNITSFQWTKISGPVSSMITNPSGASTTASSLTAGIYLFELKVTDAGGLFDRDTVQITVLSSTFNDSEVYIAGWGINASGKTVARIWRDSVLHDLSDGQYDAEAFSVFVSGNDIYVAGHERNASGRSVARLWKNGVAQNLSNGQYDAGASSVFASGTDVYVAGWEENANDKSVAKLWKNGVEQNLSNGQNNAQATSVFVSGTDVYVAGWDYAGLVTGNGEVKLWKNAVAQGIGYGVPDAGPSVFVSGNDIYMAMGWLSYTGGASDAILWKNGQTQFLQYGFATSLFVSGNDVYVAGQHWIAGDATIWKNGVAQHVGPGIANSVFVLGNDVFAVGNSGALNGTASLWKNGIGYSIPGLNAANSVFVQ